MLTLASAATTGLAWKATPRPADGDRIRRGETKPRRNLLQRIGLGRAAEDRLGDETGQLAIGFEKPVGAVLMEADLPCNRPGEGDETT